MADPLDEAFILIGRTVKCMADDLSLVVGGMPNEDQARYYALDHDLREALPRLGAAIDRATSVRACAEAVRGISDDYQTSKQHHPCHVLIPLAKFEQLQAAEDSLTDSGTAATIGGERA